MNLMGRGTKKCAFSTSYGTSFPRWCEASHQTWRLGKPCFSTEPGRARQSQDKKTGLLHVHLKTPLEAKSFWRRRSSSGSLKRRREVVCLLLKCGDALLSLSLLTAFSQLFPACNHYNIITTYNVLLLSFYAPLGSPGAAR